MPWTEQSIVKKLEEIPSEHSDLYLTFKNWLLENENSSNGNAINYLKVLYLFSRWLVKTGKVDLLSLTRDDILSFLNSRKKTIEEDPDQKWIVTWNDYLGRLKGFFRWLHNKDSNLERNEWKTPDFVNIKRKRNKRLSRYCSNDVWAAKEILTVAKYANNARDKALLTVMFDLAGRNHEVVKLRIRDIMFKEKYAEAMVSWDTKTGMRPVPLIASFPFIRNWLNEHPFNGQPDAYVFISFVSNKPLSPSTLWNMTDQLKKKIQGLLAEGKIEEKDRNLIVNVLKKPWNPYLIGRHSSLTEKSNILTDHQWIKYAGLSHNTKRRGTYIHLSGKEINDPLLKHYGILEENRKEVLNRSCPRCNYVNTIQAKFCEACSYILDPTAWEEVKREEVDLKNQVQELREQMGGVLHELARMERSKPIVPSR